MATKQNPITRYKEVEINGKKYRFQYTLKSLILSEKELDKKSILSTIAEPPMNMNDTFVMWKGGIIGGGNAMAEEEIEDLMMQYLDEHNLGDVQTLILEALMASGTIGKLDTKNV